jgi:hypothetical protein
MKVTTANWKRAKLNPIDLMSDYWPKAKLEHITFDPTLTKGQYKIIRQGGGDGTLLFTSELIQDCLINIVNGSTYFKPTEPLWYKVKGVRYTIGKLSHATVFGKIYLKCSKAQKYPGQIDRVSMPVNVEYIYK